MLIKKVFSYILLLLNLVIVQCSIPEKEKSKQEMQLESGDEVNSKEKLTISLK